MLNEAAYLESPRATLRWLLGCALTVISERIAYELERIFMIHTLLKVLLGLVAVLVVGAVGVYIDAKPYQRARIWIAIREATHSGQRQDLRHGDGTLERCTREPAHPEPRGSCGVTRVAPRLQAYSTLG
jgi:hypothetical protein